ncbi:MAG: alpha/beta fold hydrolase [Bacteroidales bacterium]
MTHYSQVFGKEKKYRLYLPANYNRSEKKYPVVYFFHGWGGRYFKDDNAKLEYGKLGELVTKYQVIMVMWDGSMDESDPRPYNIGNHEDVKYDIQMKDYFTELIAHIDSTYRTLADRGHRGIIGFSMGGIMSFYLAGKYPDKVSAAVNMVGSPEFFIGLPDNHTLYQNRYTFDNLRDVGLLFHNRKECPMTGLNDEVNQGAIWSELKNYEYHKLEGGHKVDDPGKTKVFESVMCFIVNQFDNPVPLNKTWSHYDLCPDFNIWNYSVTSNKDESGFLFLRNVDTNGFGFYTRKWLPDGPPIKGCKATISTAPIYEHGGIYEISIYSKMESKLTKSEISADQDGRLHSELTGEGNEIGISRKGQQAGFVTLGYQLSQGRKFLRVNQPDGISVNIFDRGGSIGTKAKLEVILSCADSSVTISSPVQIISFPQNQQLFKTKPFKIYSNKIPPSDGSPEWVRMKVEMNYDSLHFHDNFLLPVSFDVPYFENIQIDDGRFISATKNQSDYSHTATNSTYGSGNGDGVVSPGEQIMLYENDHRLRLFTDDPYVITSDEKLVDEVLPALWPDGFTLSSVVKIADNCPVGHEIEFLAHYETKTYMPIHRQVKWGKVKIKIDSDLSTRTEYHGKTLISCQECW